MPCALGRGHRRLARPRGVVSESAAKMPPVWNQRTPRAPKRCVPVDVAGLQLRRPPCGRGRTRRRAPRTPKPRSVKLSPLRTVRPTPSYGTQRISDVSTPPCRIEVLEQPADLVVGEGGDDAGAQAEAAAQAAGDVVLAAALPGPEACARCGSGPRPGRAAASPRRARRCRSRHSSAGRARSCEVAPCRSGGRYSAAVAGAGRRPRPKLPAASRSGATIQLPPTASTDGRAR